MTGSTVRSRAASVEAVLLDLLMAVMDSPAVWVAAAGDERRGLAWRDATTARMTAAGRYVSYERLAAEAANEIGLGRPAVDALLKRWQAIRPRPDTTAVRRLRVPYAFVTNCSRRLATVAAQRSGLEPTFVLSAQQAGWYKPDRRIYLAATRRLGSEPGRTLFVAGSVQDADGARAAGLRSVLVRRRADQPPPAAGVSVVESLEEVVDAVEFGRPV